MYRFLFNSIRSRIWFAVLVLFAVALSLPLTAHASKKKKADTTAADAAGPRKFGFDPTKLVWPSPPNIGRIHWLDYFAGAKIDYTPAASSKPKASWMDRLAGGQTDTEKVNPKTFPFQMIGPYGIAIDSKGLVYVADQRVGAVFIFNTETRDCQMIRNGIEAHFGWINGLAIDDDDRLFVSDGKMHRVLIFNTKHEVENQISEGLGGSGRTGDRHHESFSLCCRHAAGSGDCVRRGLAEVASPDRNRRQKSLSYDTGRFWSAARCSRRWGWECIRDRHA